MAHRRVCWTCGVVLVLSGLLGGSAAQPGSDRRSASLMDADHFEARIPEVTSREQWEARKKELRAIALNSTGLWPPPPKTPLNAKVLDEKKGPGFRVAKVYFESLPGFLVTGNLYRPASGNGPFPAVLSPHGHWTYGRLNNEESGSVPGRCIDLARMGFVVFAIDMIGYNDSLQLPHDPSKSRAQLKADAPLPYEARLSRDDFDFPQAELYGLSLAGLQTWNGVRAVDFLVSLPDVDAQRIGVTGASGGATQSLLLMAVDDRIQVAAPVNIIGTTKHPGCRCENPPGLWRDTTTVELAATFAPKPLLLPSATEDPWTHDFPERELPIFKKYYALYGAEGNVDNVHIAAGHNYNAETRAAVYEWFARHLKSPNPPITDPVAVAPELRALGDLRVFPDHILPKQALSGRDVIENWIARSDKDFQAALPASAADLPEFVSTFGTHLAQVLGVEVRPKVDVRETAEKKSAGSLRYERLVTGRSGRDEAVRVDVLSADSAAQGTLVVVQGHELPALVGPDGTPEAYAKTLVSSGYRLVTIGGYASGELRILRKDWEALSWPWAYNRDDRLNGIQDVVTGLAFARERWPTDRLTVVGLGRSGLLTAFGAAVFGGADRVVVDLAGRDPGLDAELLELLPVASLRRVGDFRTAALMLMRKPLELVNPGASFDRTWYEARAAAVGLSRNLRFREATTIWPPDRFLALAHARGDTVSHRAAR
ncbi:MAG: acetylxylan esterase [Vicinamibacteraceae bacterium]